MDSEAAATPSPTQASRIDIHHHFMPPEYVTTQREAMTALAPGFVHALQWTPEASLEVMDRNGIGLAVMTLAIPHMNGLAVDTAVGLSRYCNDYGDDLAVRYPGRFLTLAALPMPDVDAACAEVDRTVMRGGKIGAGLLTNYGDVWLGDTRYEPLFAALNERDAVVYIHPIVAKCCSGIMAQYPPAMMEFLFDTARCISSLAINETFDKFPRITFVFSHGSGAFPMVESRVQGWADRVIGHPLGRVQTRPNIFVDTASVTTSTAFAAVRDMYGIERILFGTDYPYSDADSTVAELNRLALTPVERAAIDSGNALSILSGGVRRSTTA
jgi:predicted TIM-barrel fold metal-dependent hydrolase